MDLCMRFVDLCMYACQCMHVCKYVQDRRYTVKTGFQDKHLPGHFSGCLVFRVPWQPGMGLFQRMFFKVCVCLPHRFVCIYMYVNKHLNT